MDSDLNQLECVYQMTMTKASTWWNHRPISRPKEKFIAIQIDV